MPPPGSAKTLAASPDSQSLPVKIDIDQLTIGEKTYKIGQDTPLTPEMRDEIQSQLQGKTVVILCSVGTNTRCEGDYLDAVIKFFSTLYHTNVVTDLQILACDGNQRHNYQFESYGLLITDIADTLLFHLNAISLRGLDEESVLEAQRDKQSLQDSILSLKKFAKHDNSTTHYKYVESLLKDIRESLLPLQERLGKKRLEKISKYLEHFDLYLILHSLKATYKIGNSWHKKTLEITRKYNLADSTIVRWHERLGIYGASMRQLDTEQLTLSRKQYKEALQKKSPQDLLPHERAIVDGCYESAPFLEEEAQIIQDMIGDMTKEYARLVQQQKITARTKEIRISDDDQITALTRLINQIETSDTTEEDIDNKSTIKQAFDRTINDYVRNKRRLKWLTVLGVSEGICKMAARHFIIEELPLLLKTLVVYPGETSPAINSIFEIEDGLWCQVSFTTDHKPADDLSSSDSDKDSPRITPPNSITFPTIKMVRIKVGQVEIEYPDDNDPETFSLRFNAAVEAEKALRLAKNKQRRDESPPDSSSGRSSTSDEHHSKDSRESSHNASPHLTPRSAPAPLDSPIKCPIL